MNINAAFPSKYLRAVDLGTHRPVVTIDRVEEEDIGGDHKPVLYFAGKEKGIVLNKTNAAMITDIAGTPETDSWTGISIRLYATRVPFQGKMTDAIRVEPAPGRPPAAPPRQAPKPVEPEPEPDFGGESDVPF